MDAAFGDVIIVGGGCYGSFYAAQLERARARGKAAYTRLLVVDRDPDCRLAREADAPPGRVLVQQEWSDFFDDYLAGVADAAGLPATIVPSPLMPHLMFEWLVRRARARWPGRPIAPAVVPDGIGTPYDVGAPDGTRYISFADWICPVHCIEPARCPVIGAPRTWEMADAVALFTRRLGQERAAAGPVVFPCRHRVYGVGMFDVAEVQAGDRLVTDAGAAGTAVDVVVGTLSSCHGAVSLLHLGPVPAP